MLAFYRCILEIYIKQNSYNDLKTPVLIPFSEILKEGWQSNILTKCN